jgi:hypothetical protein
MGAAALNAAKTGNNYGNSMIIKRYVATSKRNERAPAQE